MFENYLKTTRRNLARHKGYSFINVAGLALGMACCIAIASYLQFELSFDRFHKNGDRIFRLFERQSFVEQDNRKTDEENNYISFHKIDKAWKISKGRGVKVAVLDWLFDMSPEASQKYIDPISLVPDHEIGSSKPWHGEWMAETIHRIAPEGKIIPIRARPPRNENQDKNMEEQPYEQFLIEGIRYAADHGAVAVTNSMGPVRHTEKLIEVVKYAEKKGTVFIDVHPEYLEKKNGSYIFCDASQCSPLIIHTGIISVPKYPLEPDKNRDIYTWPFEMNPVFKDGWGFSNGPPIVAGVIALMKSVNPALSVQEAKDIIIRTGDMKAGFRVLNAEKALMETNKMLKK